MTTVFIIIAGKVLKIVNNFIKGVVKSAMDFSSDDDGLQQMYKPYSLSAGVSTNQTKQRLTNKSSKQASIIIAMKMLTLPVHMDHP